MAVEHGTSSQYAIEMRKWEAYPTQYGPPGRPYQFHEFPKRMYRAERTDKGIQIVDARDVNNSDEQRNLESRGFCFGQDRAIAAIQAEHVEHGTLAAEREYAIRHGRLSESAVSEVRAAEEAHGARHLPDVPVTPIKRRGPKPKKAEPVTA